MDFDSELKQRAREYDAHLMNYLTRFSDERTPLFDAVRHGITAGGKRLRMAAVIESARMFADECDAAVPFACAVEFIHSYSLIHDDLPAMDDADYRRGALSVHKKYGECAAILAGDALLTYAFEIMSETGAPGSMRALNEIAKCSGTSGMVLGQALDTLYDGPVNYDTLLEIYRRKTSSMFYGPMRAGAILAGADEAGIGAAGAFAESFGLAFQIADDIDDITGGIASTGKAAGADDKNNKTTAVTLLGMDGAVHAAAGYAEAAVSAVAACDRRGFFTALGKYLIDKINGTGAPR